MLADQGFIIQHQPPSLGQKQSLAHPDVWLQHPTLAEASLH